MSSFNEKVGSEGYKAGRSSIRNWEVGDRPRERLRELGPSALGDAEVLAILLGSGTRELSALQLARRLLETHGGWEGLARTGLDELMGHPGVGLAKAAVVCAAMESGRRRRQGDDKCDRVASSAQAYGVLSRYFRDVDRERFAVLYMNRRGGVIKGGLHSQGGLDQTTVDVRLVMKEAILHNATRILVSHNHPSGNPEPSKADHQVTRRLVEAGRTMGIEVCDHLIWCEGGYYSFADQGILT